MQNHGRVPARSALSVLLVGLACFVISAGYPTEISAEWKGTRTLRDGVVHMLNPAQPMEPPQILELRECWRIASETPAGELVFGAVEEVQRDAAGNFYLLDLQLKTVHAISREGAYLREIGREGEGPGEFQWPLGLVTGYDDRIGVLDAVGQKIVFLTHDGVPAGDWRPLGFEDVHFSPLFAWLVRDGVLLSCQTRERMQESVTSRELVALFDDKQNLIATVAEKVKVHRRGEPFVFDEEASESFSFMAVDSDGTTYISPEYSEYRIDVFGPDTALRMVIEREYDPVARTPVQIADVRASWEAFYRTAGNVRIIVKELRRAIMGINLRADSTIWVETSRGWADRPEETAVAFDVFDGAGRFVRQIALKGQIDPWEDYLFVRGDRILLIKSGFGASQGALGVTTEDPAASDEQDVVPVAICYEMIPS